MARPYGEKIRNVAAHISKANPEYRHPFVIERGAVKRLGIIVVTADKGLCGGLNTNVLRLALTKIRDWQAQGDDIEACAAAIQSFLDAAPADLARMGDTAQQVLTRQFTQAYLCGNFCDALERALDMAPAAIAEPARSAADAAPTTHTVAAS